MKLFFRTAIRTLSLICFFILTRQKITSLQNKKRFYVVISEIAIGMSWLFLYEAYTQIGVAISSLLYYLLWFNNSDDTFPFLFHEKLTNIKIIGFIIVLIGVFLINGSEK